MWEPAWIAAFAAIAALGLNIAFSLWKGGRNSANATLDLNRMESRLAQTIAETARDLEDRQDQSTKMFGETAAALREQMRLNEKETMEELHSIRERMSDVEKWARDEFVRKESFREIVSDIKSIVAEHARNMNDAVKGVRSAVMSIATGHKIESE